MRKLIILLLFPIALTIFAQGKKTVAVLDPICRDNSVNGFFQQMVRGSMESAVTASSEYEAYDRSAFDMIQKEQAFQRTGAVNDSQIKQMGEMAGVDYVLVSEVSAYEGYLSVVVKILNVTTGKYDKSIDDFAQLSPETVKSKCKELASSLFGKIPFVSTKAADYISSNRQDYIESAYGINMKMIWVEGGEFIMGCTKEQENCEDDEIAHRVKIDGFFIGKFEVTQSQWEKVMHTSVYQQRNELYTEDDLSEIGVGQLYPMYFITWKEAMNFCRVLSNQTGKTYTLPTEAQWEYAARGGNNADGTKYSGSNTLDVVAWYDENNDYKTHPCGTKRSNSLGVFDMSGNVWEWCNDWYGEYPDYTVQNPTGSLSGNARVIRGGGVSSNANLNRVSSRAAFDPNECVPEIGFRVVCIP